MSWRNQLAANSRSLVRHISRRRRSSRRGRSVLNRAVFELLENRQMLSVATVSDNSDNPTDPGSLRYILNNAVSGEVIQFSSTLSGQTISLTGGDFTIGDGTDPFNLTINGLGASNLTISGGGLSSILAVNPAADVSISGLTITDSKGSALINGGTLSVSDSDFTNNNADGDTYGGAILNYNLLTVTGSSFSNNTGTVGGAVYNGGTAIVDDTSFTNNNGYGGGINNTGILTISNAVFSDNTTNSTGGGGGILNDGMLNVTESTFSNNSALAASESGGGIDNEATAEISDCTFNGNIAGSGGLGGGGLYTAAEATVINSTFYNNTAEATDGGAIYAAGSLVVTNSTIDANTANAGGGIYIAGSAGVNLYNTIVAQDNNGDVTGTLDQNGPATASSNNFISGNPDLGALANNGGPTETMAPQGSDPSIIGKGNPLLATTADGQLLVTDQRGYFRVTTAGTVDIGAYQTDTAAQPSLVVNSTGDGVAYVPGYLTLRQAIGFANFDDSNSTITFSSPVFNAGSPGTITLTGGTLELSNPIDTITIEGQGANAVTVGGSNNVTGLLVDMGVTAFLSDLTIANCCSGEIAGGGVENQGTLTITDVTFDGNSNASAGGAIDNGGTLTITGGTFTNNNSNTGAAINNGFLLTVNNSLFESNVGVNGGAINNSGVATLNGSAFDTNVGTDGGAINNPNALTINDCTFSSNTAANDGGSIYNGSVFGGTLEVEDSTFTGDMAEDGGGIFNNGSVDVTGSTFNAEDSSGGMYGGGAICNTGNFTIENSVFTGNTADGNDGGAIYNSSFIAVTGSTFSGANSAVEGGAIYSDGSVDAMSSTFDGNVAFDGGGGVYNDGVGYFILDTFTQNSSLGSSGGGAVYTDGPIVFANDNTIVANMAVIGGGIEANSQYGGDVILNNSIVAQNTLDDGSTPNDVDGSLDPSSSSNLIGDGSGGVVNGENGACGNLFGTVASPLNPLLAPLGNYSGIAGAPQTMPPLPGSPAINGGNYSLATDANGNPLATDERGQPMPSAIGTTDIGAVQTQGYTLTKISGDGQSTFVNMAFGTVLQVQITANNGLDPVVVNTSAGIVTFSVSPAADGASATLGNNIVGYSNSYTASITADGSNPAVGLADVYAIANGVTGSFAVSASTTNGSNSFTLTNLATPVATSLTFIQQPTDTAAGSDITPAVEVAVDDQYGNILTTDNSSITISLNSGVGVLNGTLIIAVHDGIATFSDLSIDQVGTFTLLATDGSIPSVVSVPFNIHAGAPEQLVFAQQPTNTTAGVAISPPVTVDVEDQYGNLVTTDDDNITMTVNSGPGTLVGGSVTVAAVNGVATYSNLVIDTAGSYTLKAADGSITATSNCFLITAGAAEQLAFITQPTNTIAGNTITPAVQVAVEDQFGNIVTTDSDNISIAINSGPGSLNGTLTEPASSGVATFSDLSIDKAGTYTLAAADGSLTAVSNSFLISAASATQLVYLQQPTSTTAGSTITPAVEVAVEDQFGNILTSDSDNVTISVNSGPGSLNGTLTVPASNGVATFSNLSIDTAGTYVLNAADGSLTKLSNSFVISAGAAEKLVYLKQPTNTTAGSTITPAVEVAVEDQYGNILTSDNDNITISINTGPGSLNGTLTVPASGGIATFGDLSINKAGTYTLKAADGLISAVSNSFVVSAASAMELVFIQQPSNTTAGSTITPAVEVAVEDQYGNILTSDSDNITISINSGPGSLNGTLTDAAHSGVATFSDLSIDTAGTYTLKAADSSLTALSNSFVISAGAAEQLVFLQQPTNTDTNATISPAVTVEIEDQYGNVLSSSSDDVTISVNTGPGSLNGTLTVAANDGMATFSNLSLNAPGMYVLKAADGSISTLSNSFTVTTPVSNQQIDLTVTQTVNNFSPNVGTNVMYTITVSNAGGYYSATNLDLSDILPSGETLVSSNASQGGYAGGVWSVGTLASGASATLTITATVNAFAAQTNTSYVSNADQIEVGTTTSASTTINPQEVSLSVTESVNNSTPNVGNNVTFTILVSNANGFSNATDVDLHDLLPSGLTFVSDVASEGTYTAGSGVWSVGSISAGGNETLTITATANAFANQTNTVTITSVDQTEAGTSLSASATVNPQEVSLSVTDNVNNSTPNVGSNVVFTILVSNANGFSNATDVSLNDLLPSGLTFVSASFSQGSYNAVTGVWSIGSIASGSSATLTITATASAFAQTTNTATISSADQTEVGSPLSASVTINPEEIDLAISQTVSNSTPNVGTNVTYTILISNAAGYSTATNVSVNDLLPGGLTFVSSSATLGTYNSATGVWSIGSLAGNSSATLTIVATAKAFAAQTNNATVSASSQTEIGTNLNSSTTINPQEVDLAVTQTVNNTTPNVGTNVVYTITVSNASGYSAASGVNLNDLLPSGMTLVSATPSQGTYNSGTGVWSVGSLVGGGNATLSITATAKTFATQTNTSTVSSAAQTDVGTSLSASTTINPQEIDLAVTNTVNNSSPSVGTNVAFTVTVSNAAGYDAATSVNVNDLLPASLTFVSATAAQGTYNSGTGVWSIGTIAAGASTTLTITATVTNAAAPSATDTAAIAANSQTDAGTNLTASATVNVSTQVDLTVTNSVADASYSNVSCNFNSTSLPANDCVWFDGVFKPTLPSGCTSVTYNFTGCQIDFSANGCNYAISVPNSCVTFSSNCTTATTTYNQASNCWTTTAPCSGISGNTFLDGCEYQVPSGGLPGGISNVTWCGNFTASQSGCGAQWQFSAACYDQNFSSNYNSLGIKACDGSSHSNYDNTDCAGTPECYKGTDSNTGKSFLCGGATGSGGSNYTGNCGGTATCGTVSTGTTQVCEGDNVVYTVTVSNAAGYGNATGVALSDLLPPGISFTAATASQGTYNSTTGLWSVGSVASGATATLQITAKATEYGVFVSTATVTAVNQTDVDANPSASVTLIVGASATGEVFNDANGDGTLDNGDTGLAGVTVELVNSNNVVVATTTSSTGGIYSFLGVAPGSYTIEFVAPTGYDISTNTASNGQCGNEASSNCGNNWNGSNCNGWNNNNYCGNYGDYDNYGNNCSSYSYSYGGCTYTGHSDYGDCGGGFDYQSCGSGCYSYEYCGGGNNNGCGEWGGNSNDCGNAGSVHVTLSCGTTTGSIDAGMYLPVSIGNYVWQDSNGNGLQDSSESGISGVTVKLLNAGGSVLEQTQTNNAGDYSFTNLVPGTYVVQFIAPGGYDFTTQGVGSNVAINSAANQSTGKSNAITLTSGQTDNNVDAGMYKAASVSGYDFVDYNNDGNFDENDAGINGVTVELLNANGQVVATTTTSCGGAYTFSNMAPGTYSVYAMQNQAALQGYLSEKDTPGTVNGSTDGVSASVGMIGSIVLGSGANGSNYNFGESAYGQTLTAGDSGSIEFWASSSGQSLITSLNTGANSTTLGNWLASNFANLYGSKCGSYNLTNKTNTQVAQFFLSLYNNSNAQTNAQVLACGLNCYATNSTLCGTAAVSYGFNVEAGGCGTMMFNTWSYGAACGASNYSVVSVLSIIQYCNSKAVGGNLYDGNGTLQWEAADVFQAINQAGDIGTDLD
jgi:uncharacterized repeat protein (TIGR01451 family)